VASGTTPKQVRREGDTQLVGYGSMLMEAALAVLVIVAVGAGIGMAYQAGEETLTGAAAWSRHYGSWAVAGGLGSKISAVVVGAGNMIAALGIPKAIGIVIMGVFIASFAGTTLDTATRIQRYVVSELGQAVRLPALGNRWLATAVAVGSAGALAYATGADGKGALKLWPMFGAVNQLLAALALLVVTIYLKRCGTWGYVLTLIPCLFMLVLTIWSMIANEANFLRAEQRNWVLIVINAATFVLAVALVLEAMGVFLRPGGPDASGRSAPEPEAGGR